MRPTIGLDNHATPHPRFIANNRRYQATVTFHHYMADVEALYSVVVIHHGKISSMATCLLWLSASRPLKPSRL
jgi:ABC-type uncharacterized transport system ATPase subunit